MADLIIYLSIVIVILLAPYVAIAAIFGLLGRRAILNKDYSFRPKVSIFLPTYNEEAYVERKLSNLLLQTYPIHEILVYDCSKDCTPSIVLEFQKRFPIVRLVKQEMRIGMAKTLNSVLSDATGDIIVKTDCDSLIKSENALEELIANFASNRIGGVTGVCIAKKGVEKYFRKIMTTIQIAETNLDSTIIAHSSSLLAFRKSAAEAVSADSMAEDTEEFVLIRKKGFRTIVDPNVVCEEEVPQGFGMRRMQKARRAQGIVNVLLGNRPDVFNRKYGKFGSIVVPIEIFILVISPFTLISIIGLSIAVLYQIYPLVSLAVFAIIVAAALSKSTVIWSIMDAQLNSLIGTVKSISKKDMPLWEKVR